MWGGWILFSQSSGVTEERLLYGLDVVQSRAQFTDSSQSCSRRLSQSLLGSSPRLTMPTRLNLVPLFRLHDKLQIVGRRPSRPLRDRLADAPSHLDERLEAVLGAVPDKILIEDDIYVQTLAHLPLSHSSSTNQAMHKHRNPPPGSYSVITVLPP